jgi:ketosteroid isomerase-like protein
MSQQNVELVRVAFAEIARLMRLSTEEPDRPLGDDYARIGRLLDPLFELVPAASAVERRTLRGLDGFVTFLEGGRDTWRDVSLEAEEFLDLGDRVLAIATFRANGRASGAKIEQPNATIWSLKDRRVASVQVFFDRREALAAAGLPE